MADLIERQAAIDIASGFCHPANIAKELAKLPSAQQTTCKYWDDESSFCALHRPSAQPEIRTQMSLANCISRQAAYDALMAESLKWDDSSVWESARCHQWMMDMDVIKALPSAQTELEDNILAIDYTGKERYIYIGGRLFAVRELVQ